jgi:hypothetical protein
VLRKPGEDRLVTMTRTYLFDSLKCIWAMLQHIKHLNTTFPALFPQLAPRVYDSLDAMRDVKWYFNNHLNTTLIQKDQAAAVQAYIYGSEFKDLYHEFTQFKKDWENSHPSEDDSDKENDTTGLQGDGARVKVEGGTEYF